MDSLNELKTFWEHSNDGILILNEHADVLYANPANEIVSGLNAKEVVNNNIRHLLKRGLINDSASLKAIEAKRTTTRQIVTATGHHIISTAAPVVDKLGQLQRVICNIRNVNILPRKKELAYDYAIEMPGIENLGISSYKAVNIGMGERKIVFKSRKMRSLIDLAIHLGQVDSTILIQGETGVGKDLIAHLIHSCSPRSHSGKLVKINCAAIPQTLIESELFGHEAGAYTGALKKGKEGFIELAHRGTLFLDEITELSLGMQSKLLGVLQDREVIRVGGRNGKHVDIRFVAASNQNIEQRVNEGKFRKDLFYRLNVIPLEVPPLRDRKIDIPPLFVYFCKRLEKKYQINMNIKPEVVNQLLWYSWPGNVRELESLVERLLVTIPQNNITPDCLPYPYAAKAKKDEYSLKEMLEQYELELICETLKQCKTNNEAAERLGISLSSLRRKIRNHEISRYME